MSNNKQNKLPIDWYLNRQEGSSDDKTTSLAPASELMKTVAVKVPVKVKIKKGFSLVGDEGLDSQERAPLLKFL